MASAYNVLTGCTSGLQMGSWRSMVGLYKELIGLAEGSANNGDKLFIDLLSSSAVVSAVLDTVGRAIYKLGVSRVGGGRPSGTTSVK